MASSGATGAQVLSTRKEFSDGRYQALSPLWMKAAGVMIRTRKDELQPRPLEFLRCWKVEQKLGSNLEIILEFRWKIQGHEFRTVSRAVG